MILLAALAIASTFWSVDPDWSLHYAVMLFQLVLVTWIAASCIEDGASFEMVAWFLVLSSIYPALTMVREYLSGAQAQYAIAEGAKQFGERIAFSDADPNLNAYRIAVSVLAAIHLLLNTQGKGARMLLAALACLFVAAALLTGSRGGALALGCSTAILLLANFRRRKGSVLLILACFTALLLVTLPNLPASVSARYLGIEQEVATGTMAKRKLIYKEAEASFGRHPSLGVGYVAFQEESRRRGGLGLAAHNDPLEIIMGLGLVGFGVYALLMAALLWAAGSVPSPAKGLALGLFTAYAVSGLSITLLATKEAWVCFGIILGAAGQTGPVSIAWNRGLGQWLPSGESRHV